MLNFYQYAKNTGVGSVNIKWCGKKIKFTKDGNYPRNTNEYLWSKMIY